MIFIHTVQYQPPGTCGYWALKVQLVGLEDHILQLILINWNVHSHIWLAVTMLDSGTLENRSEMKKNQEKGRQRDRRGFPHNFNYHVVGKVLASLDSTTNWAFQREEVS